MILTCLLSPHPTSELPSYTDRWGVQPSLCYYGGHANRVVLNESYKHFCHCLLLYTDKTLRETPNYVIACKIAHICNSQDTKADIDLIQICQNSSFLSIS